MGQNVITRTIFTDKHLIDNWVAQWLSTCATFRSHGLTRSNKFWSGQMQLTQSPLVIGISMNEPYFNSNNKATFIPHSLIKSTSLSKRRG